MFAELLYKNCSAKVPPLPPAPGLPLGLFVRFAAKGELVRLEEERNELVPPAVVFRMGLPVLRPAASGEFCLGM